MDELKDTWYASEAVDAGDYTFKQHQLRRLLLLCSVSPERKEKNIYEQQVLSETSWIDLSLDMS